jgi:hypothetical protein
MTSEDSSPVDIVKEPSPPPPVLILEPSAEAGSPEREPQEVPVVGTSGGTPAAADTDEAVPDKHMQTSAESGHYGRSAWTDCRERRLHYRRSRDCREDA